MPASESLSDNLNGTCNESIGQLVVAGLAAPDMSHAQRTVCTLALKQATTVPGGNTETLSSQMGCQSPGDDVLNNFKPVNFVHREKLRTRSRHIRILSR